METTKGLTGSIIILLILGLVSCAGPTGYTKASSFLTGTRGYGYSDKRINNDEFSIVFVGNPSTSKVHAAKNALLRAAHLTKDEGRTHFVIINQKVDTTEKAVPVSIPLFLGGVPVSIPVGERTDREPMAILLIRILPLQSPYPPDALNANEVIEQIAKQLGWTYYKEKGQYDQAESDFKKAIEPNPKDKDNREKTVTTIGGKEVRSEEQVNVLRCFTDTYWFIQRDCISPPTFLGNFENTLKGIRTLLGKERLSYTKTPSRLSISSSGETIKISDIADDNQRLNEFKRMFSFVERTNPEFDLQAIVYAATKGITQVDPYSVFLPRDEYKQLQDTSRFQGIGVETTIEEDVLTVVSVIEDSPALRAGILAGDQIIIIDGTSTKGLPLMESVKRLSGPKGSPITITIMREGFSNPKDFTIIRDVVPLRSAQYELLEQHYGYIRLYQFLEKTDVKFDEALKVLEDKNRGALKGLILDLRNNAGGLLDQCVKLADKFIESGLIISVTGRREDQKMKFYAHREGTLPHYPLVVLTNNGTAAGAEIVAGALKDHKRAIIVGKRTSGRGTLQTIYPLRDGSGLRLTTAKWLTRNGNEIEGQGILPDLIVISKKDKFLSSVPSNQPVVVVESNEKEAILRIALEILKNTSSSSLQDLMGAAKKIKGIEMEQQQSDTSGKK